MKEIQLTQNKVALVDDAGIYQIVNKISQKRYIGYASNIRTRWNGHLHDLRNNKHPNNYLQNAWNKYGEFNFVITVLQKCKKPELCLYEDYWVKVLKTTDREFGYNLRDTDPNGTPGHSIETIEKLKNANTGRSRFGKANHFFGHLLSDEHKEKMRKGRSNVDYKKLHRERRGKKVLNFKTGIIYDSLAEASESINMYKGNLSRMLLGKRKNNTNLIYLDQ